MQTYNTNATDNKYDEINRISQSMNNVIHQLSSSMSYWNAKYRKLREK